MNFETNDFDNAYYIKFFCDEVNGKERHNEILGPLRGYNSIRQACFQFIKLMRLRESFSKQIKIKTSGNILYEFQIKIFSEDNNKNAKFNVSCPIKKSASDNFLYYYWLLFTEIENRFLKETSLNDEFEKNWAVNLFVSYNYEVHLIGINQAEKIEKITRGIEEIINKDNSGDKLSKVNWQNRIYQEFTANKINTLLYINEIQMKCKALIRKKNSGIVFSQDKALKLFNNYEEFLLYSGLFNLVPELTFDKLIGTAVATMSFLLLERVEHDYLKNEYFEDLKAACYKLDSIIQKYTNIKN